jgi:DEAD/DEAH box helicase domain-containing protein
MHTASFWLTVPEAICARLPAGRAAAIDGLRGVGLAFETVATLALMTDGRDIGMTLGDTAPAADDGPTSQASPTSDGSEAAQAPETRQSPSNSVIVRMRGGPRPGYDPTLFLYEHTPGGIGLSPRMFEERDVLLYRTLRLIETCPCPSGCPACVGPAEATLAVDGDGVVHSRKSVALDLLRLLVGTA